MKALVIAGVAALGAAAAVTMAPSSENPLAPQRAASTSQAGKPGMPRKLSIDAAEPLAEPACNATSFAQLPGNPSMFIGRRLVTIEGKLAGVSGANDCSGGDPANEAKGRPFNRWGLVLDRFDWKTHRFISATALLDTSIDPRTGQTHALVTGGPMRGLRIRSAYDPTVALHDNTTYVAFECTVENGSKFNVDQTSSCISVYDPNTGKLDMDRTLVILGGIQKGAIGEVAAVPRLLAFKGRLYLYWSALKVGKAVINSSAVRGAELTVVNGIPQIKGAVGMVRPFDPLSTEVWTLGRDKMSNQIANLMGFWVDGDSIIAFAALGGRGCNDPLGKVRGCYRLAAKRSSAPLGQNTFGGGDDVDLGLPTNPQEYAALVVDPQGRRWLMGHFIRPPSNGFADRIPAPPAAYWRTNKRQSALVLVPIKGS